MYTLNCLRRLGTNQFNRELFGDQTAIWEHDDQVHFKIDFKRSSN